MILSVYVEFYWMMSWRLAHFSEVGAVGISSHVVLINLKTETVEMINGVAWSRDK